MKQILIFGSTGNIGAYFVDYCKTHLNPEEYNVVAVGRKDTDFYTAKGIDYIQLDIRNRADFERLPEKDVYAVVHLAGLLPAYMREFDPVGYINTNVEGSLNILEYSRKHNVDRVIYTQTWAEQAGYWGKETVLRPEMPRKLVFTGDHAFYSITKSMVEDMMEFYKQEYGIKNFVFRLPNVYLYSPQQYYYVDGVKKPISYRYMIERASSGENLEIWGDPDAFKDVLYVKDLCKMMFLALFADREGGLYNAGTGIKTTLREQIQGIVDVFAPEPNKVEIIERPEKPSFTSFVMDISSLRNDLGYEPDYSYHEYLNDYKKERELKRFDVLWGNVQ